jgi:hypothetical protein
LVYDARYQGTARIEYPLHPLYGTEGKVFRQVKCGAATLIELRVGGKRITVPQWMTRAELCRFFTCGFDPVCDWQTLRELLQLLDEAD